MTSADPLADLLDRRGYVPLGGLSNRVFLHRERGEVLKLAVSEAPIPFPYRIAGFRACREASDLYASKGLMPEVLEVGEDFAGAGYPYLRERFIPGRVLTAAYLDNPSLWERRFPDEIVRIYRALLDSPPRDLATFWDERIEALDELRRSPHFSRFGDFHAACRDAVLSLRERCATGYRLHGDLQFGNLIAAGDGGSDARVMLLDWELTAVLPLALEFAYFYAFLHDPVPQVEDHLKQEYARIRPLRRLWAVLAPCLRSEFGLRGDDLRDAILVHRTGRLFSLDRALRAGRDDDATYWERQLRQVVNGENFRLLPLPE